MLAALSELENLIGNTPLQQLKSDHLNLYVKLEYNNFSGSIKDRATLLILREAIRRGDVNQNTVIVESSSGNFAISLAMVCKRLGLKFIPVIDPNINKSYEHILRLIAPDAVKVSELDATGGYLLTRIQKVKEICLAHPNSFWTNQYDNADNYRAYYQGLGPEICRAFDTLDYVFIAVSSGGTVTGVSRSVKERFPGAAIVAVDIEGSVIFGNAPKKRYISGIGSSKIPSILKEATIDDVIHVAHHDVIEGAHRLLYDQLIFGGASAGAVYYAIGEYFKDKHFEGKPNVVFFCPDKGVYYLDSIYNPNWMKHKPAALVDAR
jgi:cysteine synthase A